MHSIPTQRAWTINPGSGKPYVEYHGDTIAGFSYQFMPRGSQAWSARCLRANISASRSNARKQRVGKQMLKTPLI